MKDRLRRGQRLDKYRIRRLLADGDYATVYAADDTVEGIPVALKMPHAEYVDSSSLHDFKQEVRTAARLDHPNILSIKNAGFIDGRFVIVTMLGTGTLADRLRNRISLRLALAYTEQMIAAVAHAHRNRVIHCDVKPENFILFPGNVLRLADFGISKIVLRTVRASGSGTLGFVAPEQAMGKPSFRSDVFSLGLIICRMLTGVLPEWPYAWPPPRFDRIKEKLSSEMIEWLRRSVAVDERMRFSSAVPMLARFRRLRPKTLARATRKLRSKRSGGAPRRSTSHTASGVGWQEFLIRQFRRTFGTLFQTRHTCRSCGGPVSGPMHACPWCGASRRRHPDDTTYPHRCPRCRRGVKLDWVYCPWCHGPKIGPQSTRSYTDVRYTGRCHNPKCSDRRLMPFMRYCPWCHRKVRKPWRLEEVKGRCDACGWSVAGEYWNVCPWCTANLTW